MVDVLFEHRMGKGARGVAFILERDTLAGVAPCCCSRLGDQLTFAGWASGVVTGYDMEASEEPVHAVDVGGKSAVLAVGRAVGDDHLIAIRCVR